MDPSDVRKESAPPKPEAKMNSYFLYMKETRPRVEKALREQGQNPQSQVISSLVGAQWREESAETKAEYARMARERNDRIDLEHASQPPPTKPKGTRRKVQTTNVTNLHAHSGGFARGMASTSTAPAAVDPPSRRPTPAFFQQTFDPSLSYHAAPMNGGMPFPGPPGAMEAGPSRLPGASHPAQPQPQNLVGPSGLENVMPTRVMTPQHASASQQGYPKKPSQRRYQPYSRNTPRQADDVHIQAPSHYWQETAPMRPWYMPNAAMAQPPMINPMDHRFIPVLNPQQNIAERQLTHYWDNGMGRVINPADIPPFIPPEHQPAVTMGPGPLTARAMPPPPTRFEEGPIYLPAVHYPPQYYAYEGYDVNHAIDVPDSPVLSSQTTQARSQEVYRSVEVPNWPVPPLRPQSTKARSGRKRKADNNPDLGSLPSKKARVENHSTIELPLMPGAEENYRGIELPVRPGTGENHRAVELPARPVLPLPTRPTKARSGKKRKAEENSDLAPWQTKKARTEENHSAIELPVIAGTGPNYVAIEPSVRPVLALPTRPTQTDTQADRRPIQIPSSSVLSQPTYEVRSQESYRVPPPPAPTPVAISTPSRVDSHTPAPVQSTPPTQLDTTGGGGSVLEQLNSGNYPDFNALFAILPATPALEFSPSGPESSSSLPTPGLTKSSDPTPSHSPLFSPPMNHEALPTDLASEGVQPPVFDQDAFDEFWASLEIECSLPSVERFTGRSPG